MCCPEIGGLNDYSFDELKVNKLKSKLDTYDEPIWYFFYLFFSFSFVGEMKLYQLGWIKRSTKHR